MSVTRIPSLLEQSIKSNVGGTNPAVRQQLDVYSKAEVDAEIGAINLTPYALNSTVVAVSGALETQIQDISGSVYSLGVDIDNLDLSLTEKISTDCMQSTGISGSSTTVNGYLEITINGVSYKVALIA